MVFDDAFNTKHLTGWHQCPTDAKRRAIVSDLGKHRAIVIWFQLDCSTQKIRGLNTHYSTKLDTDDPMLPFWVALCKFSQLLPCPCTCISLRWSLVLIDNGQDLVLPFWVRLCLPFLMTPSPTVGHFSFSAVIGISHGNKKLLPGRNPCWSKPT